VKIALNGAEPVRGSTVRGFAEKFEPNGWAPAAMCPVYGLAESTLIVTEAQPDRGLTIIRIEKKAYGERRVVLLPMDTTESHLELVGCGSPVVCDLAIVDPDERMLLPAMRVGEIWTRGARKTLGYFRRPELNEEVFEARLADGGEEDERGAWLRTGDMGFLLDGQLFIASRSSKGLYYHRREELLSFRYRGDVK